MCSMLWEKEVRVNSGKKIRLIEEQNPASSDLSEARRER